MLSLSSGSPRIFHVAGNPGDVLNGRQERGTGSFPSLPHLFRLDGGPLPVEAAVPFIFRTMTALSGHGKKEHHL